MIVSKAAPTPIFVYFDQPELPRETFLRLPKILYYNPYFDSMCNDAKVLYAFLLERTGLSLKNGWKDANENYFVTMPVATVMRTLHCAKQKACKLFQELENFGCLTIRRRGQGKVNLLYLKRATEELVAEYTYEDNYADIQSEIVQEEQALLKQEEIRDAESPWSPAEDESQKYENQTSAGMNFKLQEVRKSNRNNNNSNKNKKSNLIYQAGDDTTDCVKAQISYSSLCETENQDCLDSVVHVIADTLDSSARTMRVNSCSYPAAAVKERFLTLRQQDVQYVLQSMRDSRTPIRNVRQYMLTSLYNAPDTIGAFRVLHGSQKTEKPSYDLEAYERESIFDTMKMPGGYRTCDQKCMARTG